MILITGDIHGTNDISKLSNKHNPVFREMTKDDFLIVCGDFGLVWNNDKEDLWWRNWLDKKTFTTLFVDGNHENFDLLDEFPVEEWHGGKVHKISDSIYHLMRGQLFELQDKAFFTFGGAESHDKQKRVLHESVWEQELPSADEYKTARNALEKCGYKVDYVISHCAPTDIQKEIAMIKNDDSYEENDLTQFFSEINARLEYKKWFCGHYHRDYVSKTNPDFEILYNKIIQLP